MSDLVSNQMSSKVNSSPINTSYDKDRFDSMNSGGISSGIATLLAFMQMLNGQADIKFNEMQHKNDVTRNDQEKSNEVDEAIAEASKGNKDARVALAGDITDFMTENHIKIDGMTIHEYLNKHNTEEGLDKGSLTAVKSALDIDGNRATDFVSQSNLRIQKLLQTYNVTVSMVNSMQSMISQMNKSIADAIR